MRQQVKYWTGLIGSLYYFNYVLTQASQHIDNFTVQHGNDIAYPAGAYFCIRLFSDHKKFLRKPIKAAYFAIAIAGLDEVQQLIFGGVASLDDFLWGLFTVVSLSVLDNLTLPKEQRDFYKPPLEKI